MRFISLYMMKVAFTFTYLLRTCLADDCVKGPFGDTGVFIGKPGLEPNFCASQWERGLSIVGIEVWSGKYALKGIRFTYSDETKTPIFGNKAEDDNPQFLRWDAQTKVESLKMWPNGDFNTVGRIFLTLVGGKSIDVNHNSKTFKGHQPNIDVGTGILIGAYGNAGQELATLKLLFMGNAASKVEILDMDFGNTLQDWNEKKKGLESFTLSSVLFKNSMPIGGSDLDFSFESTMIKESKMETSHASTQTWGLGYSLAVGVSVGVPVFGDVSATTTYSLTYGNSEMFTNTEGTTRSDSLTWKEGGILKPHTASLCESTSIQGRFDGEYTVTIRLTTKDNKQYTYKEKGRFKSAGWGVADATCKDITWNEYLRMKEDGKIAISEAIIPSTTIQSLPAKTATKTRASKAKLRPSKTLGPKKTSRRRPQSKNTAAPTAKATSAPVNDSNQNRGFDFTA